MNDYKIKTSKELCSNARGQLIGKYGICIALIVLSLVIQISLSLLIDKVSGGILFLTPLGIIIGAILDLFCGVFTFGLCRFFLNIARCKEPITIEDLFYGFKNNIDKIILIQSSFTAITVLTSFIEYLTYKGVLNLHVNVLTGHTNLYFALSYLLPVLLKLFILPVFYVLNDHPEYSVSRVYSESFRLMKGKRLKLLSIYIIMIPLKFVSWLALGVGALWFNAFYDTLLANFYLDLIGEEPGSPIREMEPENNFEQHTIL